MTKIHPVLARILRRRHRQLDRTIKALLRDVTAHADGVRRELPESESHYSYEVAVYNDINEMRKHLTLFRSTWIDEK